MFACGQVCLCVYVFHFHSKEEGVCVCVSLTGITPSPRAWTPLPHCPKVPGIHAVPFTHDLSSPYFSFLFRLAQHHYNLPTGLAYFTVDNTI